MFPAIAQFVLSLLQPGGQASLVTSAWRPLLDPLPLESHWLWMTLPMALAIAIVYKAIKLEDLARLPRQALVLAVQFVFVMALAAMALWVVSELAGKP